MLSNHEKTLNAKQFGDSREEGNRNTYEGVPMKTIVPQTDRKFDPAINVAGLTVSPAVYPDETVVAVDYQGDVPGELLAFTPAQACALAAALQAVAVHLMEQTEVRAA